MYGNFVYRLAISHKGKDKPQHLMYGNLVLSSKLPTAKKINLNI